MSPDQIVFLLLAAIAVVGAVGVVIFNRPVRSALSLILNFFVLGALYFTLGAELLGVTQIMVYLGAIMVLFLFVVMMLKESDQRSGFAVSDRRTPLAAVVSFGLAACVFGAVIWPLSKQIAAHPVANFGAPQSIGYILFAEYAWPFEVVSILLLVGIVGSIMLAKRKF